MSFALGTATGRIEIEYDGTGIKQAEQDVEGVQKSSGKALGGLNTLGNTAGIAGAAIAAGLGVGVKTAADFEQRISAISAVSGATGAELDKLRDKSLQLGKDTAFSAGEAALAIEELAKAGLTVPDILNGAADATVALAAAGEIALPEAATIASNAMNQFGLDAAQMPKVADLFAGAANTSAVGVSDIGQALQQVGAVANLAGVSLEDVTTAIGLMGDAGIRGSDAGTSLKSMFMRLQPTTTKAYDEMNRLGLISFDAAKGMEVLRDNGVKPLGSDAGTVRGQLAELTAEMSGSEVGSAKQLKAFTALGLQTGALRNEFYNAKGETKGLSEVAGALEKSLAGMTDQQKQAALQTLFGSDAIRAAAILANEGAKGFDKFADSAGKMTAAEVAATRMDNLKGSLEEMMGSLETAGIAIGTIVLPMLRQMIDQVTKLANWFLNLSDTQKTWVLGVLAGVAALLLIFAAVAKTIIFINSLRTAFVALRAAAVPAWLATLGPILLVVAAIAAVIAIVILLWKHSETFRGIVLGVWGAIKAAVQAVADWFTGVLVPTLVGAWNSIIAGLRAAWSVITGVITAGIAIVKAVITAGLNIIRAVWNAYWKMFGPLLRAVWRLIVAVIKLGWTIIRGLFILYLNMIRSVTSSVFNAIRSVISSVMGVIRSVISSALKFIQGIFKSVWGYIGPYVKGVVSGLQKVISSAWDAIRSGTKAAWDTVKQVVSTAIDAVVKTVSGLKDRVVGFFSGAGSWLYSAGRNIIQGLLDGLTSMISAVTDKINSVTGAIARALPGSPVKEGPLRVLNQGYAGKEIVNMLIDGMSRSAWGLQRAAADVAGMIPAGISASVEGNIATMPSTPAGNGLRLISGTLDLRDGYAYISGIAQDVVDESIGYDETLGRM